MGTAISDLFMPECVIHKILSYLSFREAAQMSILSKTWLHAWFTHPNLEFRLYMSQHVNLMDQILKRYRDRKTPIEKFKFSKQFPSYDDVYDKWLATALNNGVKDLAYTHTTKSSLYPFPIFTVLAAKSLRELVLTRCDLMHLSLSTSDHDMVKCDSLRKLSLSDVRLDERMLQTLLTSCPLIVNFMIDDCIGLTKIEVRNLQKIESIHIKTMLNQRVSIHAPTLEYLSYIGVTEQSPMLNILECPSLKSLLVACENISDGFLEYFISRSQFLESLTLSRISKGLRRLIVWGTQSLKLLKIRDCEGSIVAINAPNLERLEYTGDQIPQLKIAKQSSQLSHSKLVLSCSNYLNAAWFYKLREFLSKSTSWSQVSLRFDKCNTREVLQLPHIVATPQVDSTSPQVDVLDVDIDLSRECPAFLDSLLWSCHPRRLSLWSTVEMITCFIDHLMYMENFSHFTTRRSMPWRSQLKEVKAYRYDWIKLSWKPEELRSGELASRRLKKDDRILFLLDW